ncbi:MAG: RluA family pseudouridine synthase [Abditibacteriota bacterium]|nr:RluA family pseudouridine synthase [Abditibacteriota bacterium]
MRADVYLSRALPEGSRSYWQKLMAGGKVLVNGAPCRAGRRLAEGDVLEVFPEEPQSPDIKPVDMPLDIVFEDSHIMVINKPSGITVHPAAGHRDDTLVNGLLAYSEDIAGVGDAERPGIVHRLDKDTSGLMVVARTRQALEALQRQIAAREVSRTYLAIVLGDPDFTEAVIDAPIGRSPSDRQRQAVITDTDRYTARNAVTRVTVLERFRRFTLVRCVLETGRTHQIRVHMSYIGHPVLGDPLYGGVKRRTPFPATKQQEKEFAELSRSFKGQLLHAARLGLTHPVTGEALSFEAPLPEEFEAALGFMRRNFPD